MSWATYSVRCQSFQFDIDRLFYFSFKQSVFSGQDVYIVVLKGRIFSLTDVSGQQRLDLRCCQSYVFV